MKRIKGTVNRFEGEYGVISLEDKTVNIPKEFLANFQEGDELTLVILNKEESVASQEELARNLLNEVLKEE